MNNIFPKLLPFPVTKNIIEIAKQHRFLTGLAIFYILSVIWGAYRFYSPIPQGDMWHGYVDFYLHLLDGDKSAWWGQHNEHRIIFSRILFYLDLAFLGGQSRLLVPVNVIFMMSMWYMILVYANKFIYNKIDNKHFYYIVVLITVFAYSWKQDENITWAFQSVFWAAYIFPLLAFYFLARSAINKEKELMYFIASASFGILSAGTMANGILALPLMVVMAVFIRKKYSYTLILTVLALMVVIPFLYYYQTPAEHTSFIDNVLNFPLRTVVFFIEYVGAPPKSIVVSFILGLAHLYMIYIAIKNIRQHKDNPLYISIIAFLLYYLATAIATSGGRVEHGINSALVGRYTTPAILAILLSLILYLYNRPEHIRYFSKRTITIIAVLMLGTQARIIIKNIDRIHDSEYVQAMQLEMGIHKKQHFQAIASEARLKNITIFGVDPIRDKRELLGTTINKNKCKKIDYDNSKDLADRNTAAHNTTKVSVEDALPPYVVLYATDASNIVTGYALSIRETRHVVHVIRQGNNLIDKKNLFLYLCNK